MSAASAAAALVECSSSTVCQVSVYRSDLPNMYSKYTLQLTPPVDGNGNRIPISANNEVEFKYQGIFATVICNGAWQALPPHAPADEIQNRIKCTVDSNRAKMTVDLQLYDQNVYRNTCSSPPSYTYLELDNTNEASPVCTEDNTLATSAACKWQKQNANNSLLNEQGVPLKYWVVYTRTAVDGLDMSYSVDSGDASPYGSSDSVCAVDLNSNGTVDPEEIQMCVQIDQAQFCPVDAVECTATYSDAICPSGSTLNTDTDKCEATPDISCPDGYTYNSDFDICVSNPICSNGGSLNPNTDKCEIVITTSSCPSGYTYSSSLDACVKSVNCPSAGVYSSQDDKCELSPQYQCHTGYTYNYNRKICRLDPTCNKGTYNPSTDRCEKQATAQCPSGYIYNSSLGKCIANANCPDGGRLNSSIDKCELSVTSACPSGYTYNSSRKVCERNPVCQSGTTYNASLNKCVVEDTPVCGSGFVYDSSRDLCYQSASCPGGTLNVSRDKCQADPSYTCPSGYSYNSSRGKCERNPICPSGSSYSASANKCVRASNPACPSGYSYNSSVGMCERDPDCPSGGTYSNSNNRCAVATSWNCPVNGNTYPNQSTCDSNCVQTGTCTEDQQSYYGGNGTSLIYGWGIEVSNGRIRQVAPASHGSWIPLNGNGTSLVYGRGIQVSNGRIRYVAPKAFISPPSSSYGSWVPFLFYTQSYTCSLSGTSYSSISDCQNNCSQSPSCTGVCPSGYSNAGGLCIANPTCPNGGSLNTSTDKCEYTPTFNCPSGFSYDSAIKYCVKNGAWPDGGVLNTPIDKCQITASLVCPGGYSYTSSVGKCERSPQCSTGSAYNASGDRCEKSPSHECPSGTSYNASTGYCETNASCPNSGSLNSSTDKCQLAYTNTCPSSYTYNSGAGKCQKAPDCPAGGSYDASLDVCATANTWLCPSGMNLSGSTCYLSAYCPTGGSLNGNSDKCEGSATPSCPSGYTYNSSLELCENGPVCDYGFFDPSIDKCRLSADTLCPSDYTFIMEDKCVKNPVCPSSSSFSPTLDQCTIDAIHDCLAQYSYSPTTRLCEAYPICKIGSYDPDQNSCYQGDNTCPYGAQYPCVSYQGKNQCSAQECVQYGESTETEGLPEGANDKQDDGQYSEDGECLGQIYVFNGNDRRCRSGGLTIAFDSCCKSEDYLFGLGRCRPEEIQLARLKARGLCHEIGEYCSKKIKLGFTKICIEYTKSYCCFNSKLSRIVHEQGRPQMKTDINNWGPAEGPHCRGFTPEEFQMLDFSAIDLSEWYGDITPTAQGQVEHKMQQSIRRFYDKLD